MLKSNKKEIKHHWKHRDPNDRLDIFKPYRLEKNIMLKKLRQKNGAMAKHSQHLVLLNKIEQMEDKL